MRDLAGDVRAKLGRARERLREALPHVDDPRAGAERRILDDRAVESRWIDAIGPVRDRVVPDDALRVDGRVVLEGAHGVLLDERAGFHPHTTWHSCTTGAAVELLKRHAFEGPVHRLGVVRTYLTRHGPGPFPTEDAGLRARLPERHNSDEGWQGRFRVGWPDLVLLRYALGVSPVDGLAVTHLDRAVERAAVRYRAIPELRPGDLGDQERLTRALFEAVPEYEAVPERRFVEWVEEATGARVRIESGGPGADEKRWR
jgi:adenylosuccinate synthase